MMELTPSLEDYLEAILIASLTSKVVRVKNLTESMNVKNPSVLGALKSLSKKGLVEHEKYGYVELTPRGKSLAKKLYAKHVTLTSFFHKVLGVDEKTSEEDACHVEHHVHNETMERIIKFMKFIETRSKGKPQWLADFHYYANRTTRRGTDSKENRKKRN